MRIAIVGVGTVGMQVLQRAEQDGHTVVGVADSKSGAVDEEGLDLSQILSEKEYRGQVGSGDIEAVLEADYDVLVEATPTTLGDANPGFDHIRSALRRDRHAVVANKGPIAERYGELREMELNSEGRMLFEGTVGGAIPLLSTIADRGGRVSAVRGVFNGTSNFILSRMATEGLDYEHVLAEAQDLGVADPDPAFDVEGTDTGLKCAILANVLREETYSLADVEIEGIENLPGSAFELAAQDGRTIRLIGEVSSDGRIQVAPRLVPENGPLAVAGVVNTVQLDTEYSGKLNFSGRGSGGPETASAVLADIRRIERGAP
jgi:homoserine dehydrogenase